MDCLLLISVIILLPLQSIVKKPFTNKVGDKGSFTFTAILSFVALVFFVVTGKGFEWNVGYLPYAIGFAASYIAANVFAVLAIATGSVSLSSLIIKFSLLLPTAYGLFLGEGISAFFIVGIALLIVSMILINKPEKGEKFSLKWLIFALLAFVGNGMCSITQKMHQQEFATAYKNEFMIVALGISVVASVVLALCFERKDTVQYTKVGFIPASLCGLANGAVNLFVMILNNRIPASLMFPLISAGGIIIIYLVSKFYYKEKLSKPQFIGLLIGIASVIFLNL